MSRKNILFITSWYPNQEDPTLGIFVKRHAQAAALYNNVYVLYVRSVENIKKPTVQLIEQDNFNELIIEYPKVGFKIPGLNSILKLKKFKHFYNQGFNILKKKGFTPDLVHCNVMNPVGLVALEWKKKHKIPYVITEHWTGYLDSDNRYATDSKLKFFIPKVANHADKILPVSNDLEKALIRHGLGEDHSVVRNVVDTNSFILNRKENTQFLVIADLENQQKNISGIVRAFSKFNVKNPEISLTIAGGGDDESTIREEISHYKLDNKIHLIGRVNANKLSKQLNKSHALVLFSNYENLPCVIVESFACGTPVISTDVGGIKEILNQNRGILIQAKNEEALIDAFSQVMNKNWKTEEIQQYAEDNFSLSQIGERFNDIYKEILFLD